MPDKDPKEYTDTELFDWLQEQGNGIGLIHDDAGHWAVGTDGTQQVVVDGPTDLITSYFIEEKCFFPTVREAIQYKIKEYQEEE